MKVLLLGKTKSHTGFSWRLAAALRAIGHDAVYLNPRKLRWLPTSLALAALRLRAGTPDLLVSYHADVPLEWLAALKARGTRILQYYEDFDWDLQEPILARGRLADLFVLTNSGQLKDYAAQGIRDPIFLPGACDMEAYDGPTPTSGPEVSEVAFIGAARGKERELSRVPLVQRLAKAHDFGLWGRYWEAHGLTPRGDSVEPPQFGRICRGAKLNLGADHIGKGLTPPARQYLSDRSWYVLGSGGFLLSRHVDGIEELFEPGRHAVTWRTDEECAALAKEWLRPERDAERRRIAEAGREWVRSRRTTRHLAGEMIEAVKKRG